MVSFRKMYLLRMITLISAFQCAVAVAWLWMVGSLNGCECNVFRRLVFDKVDKDHHLHEI